VIIDAHTDVLLELLVGEGEAPSLELILRHGEDRLLERYWLPRLAAGGVGIQICPLYGACALGAGARARALAQEAELRRAAEETAERVCVVGAGADLADSRLRLVLSMEGVEPLEGDPGAFDEWYERGVFSASLTWNHPNEFAGGIETPRQGLTDRGRRLVRRFGELGVVLDLAHASEQTWRDVLREGVPFSVTHACCRAVHDHPRNLADWQLEALAERGGVLGLMGLAFVVDPEAPALARWLDHFDHAVAMMGIEHVGLGADFIDTVDDDARTKSRLGLEGFTAPDDFPALVAALRSRGYDGQRLDAILSTNWLRILRTALSA
jgi:membrane dipeptidase